ncbi:adenosine deaminase-like [Argiope bruennichi]|uniref:adenosine deaminase n=1 Tax=Argiope bruennichi TaxID=94029 RepID=A0A8T0EVT8_ARGBR|nr:adenosine deaminase-like [Argiope bruennichi]KAF8778506.1 Adenosine deaminase like protein [Argiope bruennichi]
MSQFIEFDPLKQPRCKVELHAHLDGAVRLTTVWELAEKKGMHLDVKTLEDLFDRCSIKSPSCLADFLKPFSIFSPVIAGDAGAIERVAYEFCEDAAKQGVFYSEVRYCPHLFSSSCSPDKTTSSPLSPREVVMCVNRGLARGSVDFKITVRSILCCFRANPEWSNDILELCLEFQNCGVVGIDVAGDEATGLAAPEIVAVFRAAERQGIHRTAHAGEAGPAENVCKAVNDMLAERIGHGYHVVDDPDLYAECLEQGIHFETCPYSSVLTGSVPLTDAKHPIVRFAEDNANFSVSRDDPTIIQKTLDQEYDFLRGFGLKDVHFARANFNAIRSCFLPDDEKELLMQKMLQVYGYEQALPGENNDLEYILPKALAGKGDF